METNQDVQSNGTPLDITGAAQYLHFSVSTLYKKVSRGEIAHFKPGGKKLLFLREDLDAYIRRYRHESVDVLAHLQEAQQAVRPEPRLRGRRVTA